MLCSPAIHPQTTTARAGALLAAAVSSNSPCADAPTRGGQFALAPALSRPPFLDPASRYETWTSAADTAEGGSGNAPRKSEEGRIDFPPDYYPAEIGQSTVPTEPRSWIPAFAPTEANGVAQPTGTAAPGAPPLFPAARPQDRSQKSEGRSQITSEKAAFEAERKAGLVAQYQALRRQGFGLNQAAHALGVSPARFSGVASWLARQERDGIAGLAPKVRAPRASSFEVPAWFVPAAQFFYLLSNRTFDRGSVPEAVRRVISLPACAPQLRTRLAKVLAESKVQCPKSEVQSQWTPSGLPICPTELRETILRRQHAGQTLVPDSIARRIAVDRAIVRFSRNPTNTSLDLINSAGCSKFRRENGEYIPLRCGDRMQPDDGSINFCCWVPWGFPTDHCSRKFGVLVGRWQLLLFVDALSLSIRARSFVARPRSSYRTEDALHLYNIFMREHGIPKEIWHEGHVWNAGRVKDCLDLLQVRRQLVYSPHTKAAVEGRFNKLWTVMSTLSGGQIGRYRGEMERENEILTSCRGGHTDPRRVFPSFNEALSIIDQSIAEANATPVDTDVGHFVPDELWTEHLAATPLRKLDGESSWMFWPTCETRVVGGSGLSVGVPMFEDFTVPFTFAASWMPRFKGNRIKIYFDPWAEGRCHAVCVLAEPANHCAAGEILGTARQTNDIGSHAREMLGFGDGPDDTGRKMKQAQSQALRSARRAIVPNGRGAAVVEHRDGMGDMQRVESQKSEVRSQKSKTPRGTHDDAEIDINLAARLERLRAGSDD